MPGPDTDPRFPKSAYECFNLGLKSDPSAPCFGRREWNVATGDWEKGYVWETYAEADVRRTRVGSGLMQLQLEGAVGSEGPTGWTVGVWAINRPGKSWNVGGERAA